MLSNVCIATQNQDKFDIIRDLLVSSDPKNYGTANFHSLSGINVKEQAKEAGSVIQRARQKALAVHKILSSEQGAVQFPRMDIIVWSDDGMKYRWWETNPDSGSVTKNVISGKLLSPWETLTVVRAFSFVDTKGEILAEFETEIPFRYIWSADTGGVPVSKENRYPLSHVLGRLSDSRTVSQVSNAEMAEYYLSFCREAFLQNRIF